MSLGDSALRLSLALLLGCTIGFWGRHHPGGRAYALTAATAAKGNDAALEQIVGRFSLEPNVSAATWQIDRTIPEA